MISKINDTVAETCYQIENSIYEALSDDLKHVSGIFVEQKETFHNTQAICETN